MTPEPAEPDYSNTSTGLTDADVRQAMLRSIRLLAILAVLAAAIFWWRVNWQSAVLLLVGAAISCTSLWEWLRLMTAINERMDAGGTPRPMGTIVFGFITRLALTLVVLYVSLRYLHGTVLALAGGLGLGLLSLVVEASRLLKRTTP
jgi:F0F1-type ATP synthase assembly protein I